jgi:hypothetical protein
MIRLRESLYTCVLKSGDNARRDCHSLSAEYMRRVQCPNYSCPEVAYFVVLLICQDVGYLPPAPLEDYLFPDPDRSLDALWKVNKLPGPFGEK